MQKVYVKGEIETGDRFFSLLTKDSVQEQPKLVWNLREPEECEDEVGLMLTLTEIPWHADCTW